ncbi:MAG TPA: hypothetical protein VF656_18435 [Pyrinomonadaceae bacterium]|jgi:hypothetical protein
MKKPLLKTLLLLVACGASVAPVLLAQQPQPPPATTPRRRPGLTTLDIVRPAAPTDTQTRQPAPEQPLAKSDGSHARYSRPPVPPTNNCRVFWALNMGKIADCDCPEQIQINEDSLTPDIYTPAALIYIPPGLKYKERNLIEVARTADMSLRQVNMPSMLTDIVVLNQWEYEIRLYAPSQVGAKVNGLYTVSGAPYDYYIIKNPDPPAVKRLQIIKVKDGVRRVTEYVYDASSNSCALSSNGGEKTVTKQTQQNPLNPAERIDTYINRERDRVTSKTIKVYRRFPWGEELVKLVEDADGAALTTTHAYYEQRDESTRHFRIRLTVFPDGSWEEYDYTSVNGYVSQNIIRRGDGNSPPPAR